MSSRSGWNSCRCAAMPRSASGLYGLRVTSVPTEGARYLLLISKGFRTPSNSEGTNSNWMIKDRLSGSNSSAVSGRGCEAHPVRSGKAAPAAVADSRPSVFPTSVPSVFMGRAWDACYDCFPIHLIPFFRFFFTDLNISRRIFRIYR